MSVPENYQKFEGYLEKKSPGFLGSWQKRYFSIIAGQMMVYYANQSKEKAKGQIQFSQITKAVKDSDPKVFKFTLETRDFILRGESEEIVNQWVAVINQCIDDIKGNNKKEEEPQQIRKRSSSFKANRMENLDKDKLKLLEQYGVASGEDRKKAEEVLMTKGINKIFNLNDPKTKCRIHYGYLYKQHKSRKDYYQKRWFFIYSHRPLFDDLYTKDEFCSVKEKEEYKFDYLYYFREGEEDKDKSPPEPIDLSKSHKIESVDKEEKYSLILDVDDRIFELYSEVLGERDKWFEVLKNARRTAKEYRASVFKNPRNIDILSSVYDKNVEKFKEKIKDEIKSLVGDTEELKDYLVLEFSLKNLEKNIIDTIDGINSSTPRKVDLLIAYTDYMNTEYLAIIKKFWESQYSKLDNTDLLKLGMKLFEFLAELDKIQIIDENILKNGKEFIKIYMKKTFKNILDVIDSILKSERENKFIRNPNGKYCTNGPSDLFDLIGKTFGMIKPYTNYHIYEQMLNLVNECIIQYLIGVECVTSNYKIAVEKEFLLAIANNSFILNERLNSFIEDCCKANIIREKEANEAIRLKQLNASINIMTQNSVSRFVKDFSEELSSVFKENNFLQLNIEDVMVKTRDIFCSYNEYLEQFSVKKVWEEILKMSVFFYVRSLLLTGSKGLKDVHELEVKIETDKGILNETYESLVGKNLTEANLKILKDLCDFLSVSSYMISSSFLTIRDYIGPSFDLKMAETLVKLRTDFSSDDKEDAIQQCEEVLRKYENKDNKGVGFFYKMKSEMDNEVEENEVEPNEENKKEEVPEVTLDSFLNKNDEDDEDNIINEEEKQEELGIKQNVEIVTDILFEGFMEKKSHSSWQQRYFQLKNGYLYWYKDKSSSSIQNKISIEKALRVEGHKENKFLIILDDKEKKEEGEGKIYKFKCKNEDEKADWIKAITSEMRRIRGEQKEEQNKIQMKKKKKVIVDFFDLPDIGKDRFYMKNRTLNIMKKETFFKPALSFKKGVKKEVMSYETSNVGGSTQTLSDEPENDSLHQHQRQSFEVEDVKQNDNEVGFCARLCSCFSGKGDSSNKEKLNP